MASRPGPFRRRWEAEIRGLNRLYVVLTRAVSRLDVLHARDLPPQLDGTRA